MGRRDFGGMQRGSVKRSDGYLAVRRGEDGSAGFVADIAWLCRGFGDGAEVVDVLELGSHCGGACLLALYLDY